MVFLTYEIVTVPNSNFSDRRRAAHTHMTAFLPSLSIAVNAKIPQIVVSLISEIRNA